MSTTSPASCAGRRRTTRGPAPSGLLATLDARVRTPLNLTDDQQRELIAFLKSLTDPGARNLHALTPATVPSGLPVRD